MKKLFLAVSICASIVASSPMWAAQPVQSVKKSENTALAQRKIVEAATLNWAKDLARDMQLSADPLARAMADISLQMLAAQENATGSANRLTAEQKVAIYSAKTPVPVRILYLLAACAGYGKDAICGDAKLAEALLAGDPKNAFTILLAESIRADAEMQALQRGEEATSKISNYSEFVKAQEAKNAARVLASLAISNTYYDYAQAFKAPILIAIKRRPPPPEVLASLPLEVSALAAAFAPEEIAAEVFTNALIFSTVSNYRAGSICVSAQSTELKTECARIAGLILANPKNSAASAGFALSRSKNHPYAKRIAVFDNASTQKEIDPSVLLTLDWLALRGVLKKAATQGDVAAIPDALSWAELAYAKIPNKSAEAIAAESKALEEQRAEWEVQRNHIPTTTSQAEAAQAVAAAKAAAAIATKAAIDARAPVELEVKNPN